MAVDFKSEIDQPEASGLGDNNWDTIVIGAGPAGAGSALCLSEKGLNVLLLDRERFPREKTCGDGLTPEALDNLKKLDLYDKVKNKGNTVSLVKAFSPSRNVISVSCECVTIRRAVLDAIIVQEAVNRGAAFAKGEVREVSESNEQVIVTLREGNVLKAPVVVLATGSEGILPESLKMFDRNIPAQLALRRYVRSSVRIDEIIFSMERYIMPGYAWIFPMGDGLYNIGCGLFDNTAHKEGRLLRHGHKEFMENFPVARELISGGEFESPLKGSPLRCGLKGTRGSRHGRVVAVGEACATTIPFSGEGIGKALESGRRAADAILETLNTGDFSPLRRFPDDLRFEWDKTYLGYERAQRLARNPLLLELLMKKAVKTPALTDVLMRIVTGGVAPSRVFSARGVIKALMSR